MIPNSTKDIVAYMLSEKSLSVRQIAEYIGVTQQTIYRVLRGNRVSGKTDVNLIRLYLTFQNS